MRSANFQPLGFLVTLISLLLVGITVGYTDPPQLPRGKGEQCVEPTDVMRRDHMKFLLHQRDRTVHQGVRSKSHSLAGCVDCHVQTNNEGGYIPVDAPEQFCEACHTYASIKLDCFECHATKPDQSQSARQTLPVESDNLGKYVRPKSARHFAITSVIQ